MTDSDTEKDIKINLARQHIIEGLLKARRDADNILEVLKTEEDPKLYLSENMFVGINGLGSSSV